MGTFGYPYYKGICLLILFLLGTCMASLQRSRLNPGFRWSQMKWIDNDGIILLSKNSNFGFGFQPTRDITLFLLVVVHKSSSTIIWSANRASPVKNYDSFIFDKTGNAYLQSGGYFIWSTDTTNKGVAAMELQDSGNLVIVGNDSSIMWESFRHPSDTLLSNQEFTNGMKLLSNPNSNSLTSTLELIYGDIMLSANFRSPQPYWAMGKDNRRGIRTFDRWFVTCAKLDSNSWRFYDQDNVLLWQFIFLDNTDANATSMAVLGDDGFITFSVLQSKGSAAAASLTKIPQDTCSGPATCAPYYICYPGNRCQCPSVIPFCKPKNRYFCDESSDDTGELVDDGDSLGYFALEFVPPYSKTDLNGCKFSCLVNCSCIAMFFDNKSGSCFLFDQIGSLKYSDDGVGHASYIKVSSNRGRGGRNHQGGNRRLRKIVIGIVISTVVVLCLLLSGIYRYYPKKNRRKLVELESSEEDNFLESLSRMPVRFSYKNLQSATNNFEVKLGQGGFGSVYQGALPDGTLLAVKKLEGIGQGKKEFRAEVSSIGSIHHLHLVRLKGFCAQGTHRLLVYEYMANGSLDRWLFRKDQEEKILLDWDTRYNIALGTARGLAYLHEDCDAKIVHCDIKPENVLLDDHFMAKISNFGLAKLMTREESHVFTTLRGTRGYLAPEWIKNYTLSEKCDVYSYGMVLLEIIGGRRNFDPLAGSEKSNFPSYALKMMEDGKLKDIIDASLKVDEEDGRVFTSIKVALWCIQDDMNLRPPMTKVVQILEGNSPVPPPPTAIQIADEGASFGCNHNAHLSAVLLSGPR